MQFITGKNHRKLQVMIKNMFRFADIRIVVTARICKKNIKYLLRLVLLNVLV